MTFVLVSVSGDRRFRLPVGEVLTVGRDPAADLPIPEPSVSRRHAEVRAQSDKGVELRDLGSRNGTWLNGKRVQTARVAEGDIVAFGTIELYLREEGNAPRPESVAVAQSAGQTLILERRVSLSERVPEGLAARRLAQLLEVAQRLNSVATMEILLAKMVSDLFETLNADRATVMLADDNDTLMRQIARTRNGGEVDSDPPRAIVDEVVSRKAALLTRDAAEDQRTTGASVIRQAVRSAMATPLLAADGSVLGVLYIDNLRDTDSFTESDLDFLVAYAGIASAGVERERAMLELNRANRVRENFERYFAPQIASRIAGSDPDITLGGNRYNVVVLFCDIRGFTSIAESLSPDDLANQLNEYFGAMVECVFRHDGALDKFIGDALLAYWGALNPGADHPLQAARAAIDMQQAMASLNAKWVTEGKPVLRIGVGLHSGDAFVGNIGSPRRLEFALVGDTVNLANRVCGFAPGEEIIVSEPVALSLKSSGLGEALSFYRTAHPDKRSDRSVELWKLDWHRASTSGEPSKAESIND